MRPGSTRLEPSSWHSPTARMTTRPTPYRSSSIGPERRSGSRWLTTFDALNLVRDLSLCRITAKMEQRLTAQLRTKNQRRRAALATSHAAASAVRPRNDLLPKLQLVDRNIDDLSAPYVDVVLRRFEVATGIKPLLVTA